MGEVWLAQHVSIDRKVAIKILHGHFSRNESLRARFRNEAMTLSRLQHPNIVSFYDFIEAADHACLVMEYVQGRNLDDIIRKETGPMPNELLSSVFRQILLAFDHAHRAGVVHRDIKPSNFMLTDEGVLKVLDFGIAKLLEDDHHLTRTGTRMGTTFYMSPEQVNGGQIDMRSDIYSLGVTLFVLATGKNPYEGETVEFKVYNRIVHEPLPPARSIYPGIPETVERLINKATAKDPAHRFQNCGEFLIGAGVTGHAPYPVVQPHGSILPLNAFKSLRRFTTVAPVVSVLLCWIPATGNGFELGSLPIIATLASIVVAAASVAVRRGKSWGKWGMRIGLSIYALGCLGAIIVPGTSSVSFSSRTSTTWNGITHTYQSASNDNWLSVILCSLALGYAIWGLTVVFSKKNQPYLDTLQ